MTLLDTMQSETGVKCAPADIRTPHEEAVSNNTHLWNLNHAKSYSFNLFQLLNTKSSKLKKFLSGLIQTYIYRKSTKSSTKFTLNGTPL